MLGLFNAEIIKLVNVDGELIENFRTNRHEYVLEELLNEIELEFDLESLEVCDDGMLTLSRIENCDGEIASYKEVNEPPTSGLYDVHYDVIVRDGYGDRVRYDQLIKLRHEV